MMFALESVTDALFEPHNAALLQGILRGVERETLRTSPEGTLALTEHPRGLGSALTHPQITTDFSEALLEFITPPTHRVDDLFFQLKAIHRFVASQLGDELMWATSMPCLIQDDDRIPVARYGNSNIGKMKTTYRVGLGHRYGRAMQTVAGVHFNFSLPNAFWALLLREKNRLDDLQDFKDEQYFKLIRNFRQHYWLLIYLFGASPALCKSFVGDKPHQLQTLDDGHTLYLPHATSLRMGDLGYQSKVQESLYVCYNGPSTYIKSLCGAITRSHPQYEAIGLKDDHGNFKQLNTSVLQIENEFYSAIRPKRTAQKGETALAALRNRGVEYIEVRCLDVNPEVPEGITPQQVRFLDIFLLYCALKENAGTDAEEARRILSNQKSIVNKGRQPGLMLETENGEMSASEWGLALLDAMAPAVQLLDQAHGGNQYQEAMNAQKIKLTNPDTTPSATLLASLKSNQTSFGQHALALSKQHTEALKAATLDPVLFDRMTDMAEESDAEKNALEADQNLDFDTFLNAYYRQYSNCSG